MPLAPPGHPLVVRDAPGTAATTVALPAPAVAARPSRITPRRHGAPLPDAKNEDEVDVGPPPQHAHRAARPVVPTAVATARPAHPLLRPRTRGVARRPPATARPGAQPRPLTGETVNEVGPRHARGLAGRHPGPRHDGAVAPSTRPRLLPGKLPPLVPLTRGLQGDTPRHLAPAHGEGVDPPSGKVVPRARAQTQHAPQHVQARQEVPRVRPTRPLRTKARSLIGALQLPQEGTPPRQGAPGVPRVPLRPPPTRRWQFLFDY